MMKSKRYVLVKYRASRSNDPKNMVFDGGTAYIESYEEFDSLDSMGIITIGSYISVRGWSFLGGGLLFDTRFDNMEREEKEDVKIIQEVIYKKKMLTQYINKL